MMLGGVEVAMDWDPVDHSGDWYRGGQLAQTPNKLHDSTCTSTQSQQAIINFGMSCRRTC
jgi:hypothetical protein